MSKLCCYWNEFMGPLTLVVFRKKQEKKTRYENYVVTARVLWTCVYMYIEITSCFWSDWSTGYCKNLFIVNYWCCTWRPIIITRVKLFSRLTRLGKWSGCERAGSLTGFQDGDGHFASQQNSHALFAHWHHHTGCAHNYRRGQSLGRRRGGETRPHF